MGKEKEFFMEVDLVGGLPSSAHRRFRFRSRGDTDDDEELKPDLMRRCRSRGVFKIADGATGTFNGIFS